MGRLVFFLLLLCPNPLLSQQRLVPADTGLARVDIAQKSVSSKRRWIVGASSAAAFSGSFIFLNNAWYKGYDRTAFHTFSDGREWLQMDKSGHAWTAYTSARLLYGLWRWAGLKESKAVWVSAGSSILYMASIEYLDGRSAAWGWSWGDIAGNIFGAALFSTQQLFWKEQRILLKFSSHLARYPDALQPKVDELFGKTIFSRLLKDYNAQTYWLSLNLKSFMPRSKIPAWLNLAAGYGAEGMFGGFENRQYDPAGVVVFDRSDIQRRRQYYLSPDIDFTKIKTRRKWVKTVCHVLNMVKMPLPTVEYSAGDWKVHLLYF